MKSAKQRFIDAGYQFIKPSNNSPGSARRIVYCPDTDQGWVVNSQEEVNDLADELLGEFIGHCYQRMQNSDHGAAD